MDRRSICSLRSSDVFTKLRISSLDSCTIPLCIWTHRQTLESLIKCLSPCKIEGRGISTSKKLLWMVQNTSYRQFNLSCAESWTTHLYFVRAWTSSVTDKNSAAGVVRVHSFYRWNISNNRTVCYENDDGERQQMLLVLGKTLVNFWRSETFYKDLVFRRFEMCQLNNAKYKPNTSEKTKLKSPAHCFSYQWNT